MITLVSKWKLRDGCPLELATALRNVAADVAECEPGTWMYSVHLGAPAPLDGHNLPLDPPPQPTSLDCQREVTFFEVYADAAAFSRHVRGDVFNAFVAKNIGYFEENPGKPGAPKTETLFYDRQSAFIRSEAGGVSISTTSAVTSDKDEIAGMIQTMARLLLEKDVDGVLSLMTDDIVFMSTVGGDGAAPAAVEGHVATRGLLKGLTDAFDICIRPSVQEVVVQGDLAYARDVYEEDTVNRKDGATLEIKGSEMMILRRTAAGWRFSRYIFSISAKKSC